MQYEKLENGYRPLTHKNVDTGFGFERMLMFLNGLKDVYKTDLYSEVISRLTNTLGVEYDADEEQTKSIRIIADHMRTAVMLIGDRNGIVPSNVGAGYILRRIMRRAIRHANKLGLDLNELIEISKIFIEKVYDEAYPLLLEKEEYILNEIQKEMDKFSKALQLGLKEFEKVVAGIERHKQFAKEGEVVENVISDKAAFRLYDTFGFPLELTKELAEEKGYKVDEEGFKERFKEHQEKSRSTAAGEFKGGLENGGEITTHYHTATHIMLAGLKKMFGDDVVQKGSNITNERMRFDFNLDHKMTDEEIKQLEKFVNDTIARGLDVTCKEMTLDEARKFGAHGVFDSKYGEKVKVYIIGDVDKQICGGPHVKNTSELGKFRIVKEESSSAGIRRIKAVLE